LYQEALNIFYHVHILIAFHSSFCCQELYETLEKGRPRLFRLASETEENETEAISKLETIL
jgi:hypothetical protein